MQERSNPRQIPDRPNYLKAEGFHWKIPRPSTCARLLAVMFGEDLDGLTLAPDRINVFKATATENAAGAVVGFCWAARGWDIETPRPVRMDGGDDLLRYGDAVLDELEEAGLMQKALAALPVLAERLAGSALPAQEAVAEQAGFSPAQQG